MALKVDILVSNCKLVRNYVEFNVKDVSKHEISAYAEKFACLKEPVKSISQLLLALGFAFGNEFRDKV